MNVEIIAIGSELLLGQIANTNAQYISKKLAELGMNVYYHQVVGDNRNRLHNLIQTAEGRSDVVVFTGGLGPTKDDLTKETIAKYLNKNLIMDEHALQQIQAYFQQVNRNMTENNKKQALIIEDSFIFPNDNGMAPGMALKQNDTIYMLFPGPPKELYPMFENYAVPYLQKEVGNSNVIQSKVLRFFGIGEAQLETELEDLIENQTNPTIAPLAGEGEVTIRLTAKHSSAEQAKQLIEELEKKVVSRVGKYIYGVNDTTLLNEVVKLLSKKKLTIAAAESLTGGLFSKEITDLTGASSFYNGGIVCYSNNVKKEILHVPETVLNEKGAVSVECAKILAEQVCKLCKANIGISFTGVAGPSTLEGKPVGTVYIAIAMDGKETEVFPLTLAGTREAIRIRAIKYGYYYLLKHLQS